MYNLCIFAGNLTKDPELKYTAGGTAVTTLTVAVNSKFKQGGETKEDVFFVDCVVFGNVAEACSKYLEKGRPVLVDGRMRERKWEHEGKQHRKVELIANSVKFLGGGQAQKAERAPVEDSGPEPF